MSMKSNVLVDFQVVGLVGIWSIMQVRIRGREQLVFGNCDGDIISGERVQAVYDSVKAFYMQVSPHDIYTYNAMNHSLQVRQSPPESRIPKPGYIYVLKAGPFYKIGVSADPARRVDQLTTLPPFDLEVIHLIQTPDMYALETELHERFAEKRKNGEWFELDPADVKFPKGL